MHKQDRESVSATLGSLVSGRPNQASAFIFKAVEALKNDGIIGCVTPSSIFSFSSYSNLRKKLEETITFYLLGKLGNFVFEGALTDISILIAKKEKNSQAPPIIVWAKNEKGVVAQSLRHLRRFEKSSTPFINKNYSVYIPNKFPINDENWKLMSYEENEAIKKVEGMVLQGSLVRLQDIFHVKMGIRTGENNVFKINNVTHHSETC